MTFQKLYDLSMDWSDWKCTPMHFVMYNVVPGNLDKHGTHPWYLHLVNLLILYGPLGIIAMWSAVKFFGEMVSNEWQKKPGIRTVYALTMFTFVTAVGMLSLIPHQEARFLIPLTLPVVLMNAHKLRVKVFGSKPLLFLWYMFNIGLGIFYGFIHQGGITPFLHGKQHILPSISDNVAEVNIIFSHTYMPPKFQLLLPPSNKSRIPKWHFDYPLYYNTKLPKLNLIELGSKPVDVNVKQKLIELVLDEKSNLSRKKKMKTFVALPTMLEKKLKRSLENILEFNTAYYRFPHISVESLPELSNIISMDAFHFNMLEHFENASIEIDDRGGITNYIFNKITDCFDTVSLFGFSVIEVKLNSDKVKSVQVENIIPKKETTEEKQNPDTLTPGLKKAKKGRIEANQ